MSRLGRSYIRSQRITPKPTPIRQFSVPSADTASATDVSGRTFLPTRTGADTASGTDAVARLFRGTRVPTDASAGSDVAARVFIGTRSPTDTAVATEALFSAKVFVRNLADTAHATEAMVRAFTGVRTGSESGSGSDAVTRRFIGSRQPSDYKTMIVNTSGVQSYWRFNEATGASTVADSVGAVTGTYNNSQNAGFGLIAGDSDQSLIAAVTPSRYAFFGDVYGFAGTAAFTFETWINPTSIAAFTRRVFSKRPTDGSGIQGFELTLNTGSFLSFARYLNSATLGVGSILGLTMGQTYHVVCTYDGTTSIMYVNGQSQGQATDTRSIVATPTHSFTVGQFSGNGNQFDGRIDEFVVYNRALTATEVQRHYNLGLNGGEALAPTSDTTARTITSTRTSADTAASVDTNVRQFVGTRLASDYTATILADSPVGYWRLGETVSTATDSSGNGKNGTYFGGKQGVAGLIAGGDGSFNAQGAGAIGRVDLGDNFDFPSAAPFSIEAWVMFTVDGTTRAIVTKPVIDGSGQQGWLMLVSAGQTVLDLRMYRNGQLTLARGGTLSTTNPNHVVAVFDGTNLYTYVNGQLGAGPVAYANVAGPLIDNTAQAQIGAWSSGNYWLDRIDEVAIYNYALSASKIQRHYNIGLNGGDILSPTSDTSTRQYVGSRTASDYSRLILSESSLQSYWRLGEASGATTAVDQKGVVNGTYSTGTIPGSPGLLTGDTDGSVKFASGNGNGVDLGDNYDFAGTAPFSVEVIISPSVLPPTASARIVSKENLVANRDGWLLLLDTSQRIQFGRYTVVGGGSNSIFYTGSIVVGQAYHVVGVYDGARVYLYVNGVEVSGGVGVASSVSEPGNAVSLRIGANGAGSGLFQGTIDEVAIYNTALTAAQIQRHANLALNGGDTLSPTSDSLTRATNTARTILDTGAAIDTNARIFVGTRARSDTASATDATARLFTGSRLIADASSGVDTVSRFVRNTRAISDSSLGVDTPSRFFVGVRSVVETANASDAVVRRFVGVRLIASSAPASETLTRSGRFSRVVPDSQGAIDSVARHTIQARLIIDTAVANDTVARFFRGGRVFSDSAPASDAVIRSVINTRVVPDSASTADVMSRSMGFFRRPVNESAPANDTWTRRFVGTRSYVELAPGVDTYIFSPHLVRRNVVLAHLTSTKTSLVEYNTIVQTTFDTLKSYISKEQMLVLSSGTQITATTASDGSTTLYQEIVTVPLYIDTN